MSVIGKSINSIINIVFLIVIFNFIFLIASVPVAGFITGEEVLSASMGLSRDIDESVMLTENEPVTFMISTLEQGKTELLNINIVDPQNKEYSWQKGFGGYDKPGEHIEFSTVFIPESSGMHRIRISNANFNTDIKLVSGMAHPSDQPLFLKTLIISAVLLFIGAMLFGSSTKRVPLVRGLPIYRTVTTGQNRMRKFTAFQTIIALFASLYIVYSVGFQGAL